VQNSRSLLKLKRLLLFTYYYPPQPEAGSLRPAYLTRYLEEYDWATTVITPKVAGGNVGSRVQLASSRKNLRRHLTAMTPQFAKRALRNALYFPDIAIYWLAKALRDASQAVRRQRFDAVMSTALPGTMHIAGAIAHRRYVLPWLADYRDLWTPNPYREFGPIRRFTERRLEQFLLRDADTITMVSESFADPLRKLAPHSRLRVIPNALDPADWDSIADLRPTDFRFCYGGRLYGGRRSPEVLFAAIAALRTSGEPAGLNATLDFFGPEPGLVKPLIARYGLNSIVTLHGVVERSEMLRAERSSAVLVILLRPDASTASEYGSKIYEYSGAKRPVLAIGGSESVVKTLMETSGLGLFVSGVEDCKDAVRTLYGRFVRGDIEPHVEPSFKPFTARQLASRFAEVLNEMISGRSF
jgi:hypothetical protein